MNRRNFIRSIGAITTGATITALAGCTGNGNGSSGNGEQNGYGPNGDIELSITPTEGFNEHASFSNPAITADSSEGGRPDGMIISWDLSAESAPNDTSCLGTLVEIETINENEEGSFKTGDAWGYSYTVGESHVAERFIPVPADESQDGDFEVPERIEITIDVVDNANCE